MSVFKTKSKVASPKAKSDGMKTQGKMSTEETMEQNKSNWPFYT